MKNNNIEIGSIFIKGINKALERINKISFSKWIFRSFSTTFKSGNFDSVSVYSITNEKDIAAVMCVKRNDIYDLVRFFIGKNINDNFSVLKIYELVFNEIGNIILNSIIGEIANHLNIKIIPSLPVVINGDKFFILENLSTMIEENSNKSVLMINLVSEIENKIIEIEIYIMLSPQILERL